MNGYLNNNLPCGKNEKHSNKEMCCVNTVCCYPISWDCDCKSKDDNKKPCRNKDENDNKNMPCECKQNWFEYNCNYDREEKDNSRDEKNDWYDEKSSYEDKKESNCDKHEDRPNHNHNQRCCRCSNRCFPCFRPFHW